MNRSKVKKGQLLEESQTTENRQHGKTSVYLYEGDVYRVSDPPNGRGYTKLIVKNAANNFSDAVVLLSASCIQALQKALKLNIV